MERKKEKETIKCDVVSIEIDGLTDQIFSRCSIVSFSKAITTLLNRS